jgi:type I restriction enzyme, S subunit
MTAWEKTTLGEAFCINPSRTIAKDGVTPFFPMDALSAFAREPDRIDERAFTGSGMKFQNGDTIVARITPCLENGKTAYIQDLKPSQVAHGSTEYIVITGIPDKTDNLFAYYVARSELFRNYAIGHMEGTSGRQRVPASAIAKFPIDLPPIQTQRAIAQVLGALDDKIALNRRMNATLEAMARALFKDWFVDFGPVRARMAGSAPTLAPEICDLFPSAIGADGLPVGWVSCGFGDTVEPKRGQTITRKTVTEGNIPVIAGGLSPAYYHNKANVSAPVITVSASGANAGFVQLHHDSIWASDCSYIDTKSTTFIYTTFIFLKIKQHEITKMQQGAAQPHVYPSDLKRLVQIKPSDLLNEAYERTVAPFFAEIAINEKESKNLATLRDTLLPMLLSGELSADGLRVTP